MNKEMNDGYNEPDELALSKNGIHDSPTSAANSEPIIIPHSPHNSLVANDSCSSDSTNYSIPLSSNESMGLKV